MELLGMFITNQRVVHQESRSHQGIEDAFLKVIKVWSGGLKERSFGGFLPRGFQVREMKPKINLRLTIKWEIRPGCGDQGLELLYPLLVRRLGHLPYEEPAAFAFENTERRLMRGSRGFYVDKQPYWFHY